MEPLDIAMLVLRVSVGAVAIAHGVNHGRNLDGTAAWFEKVGFRQARLQASLSAAGEVAVGSLLVLGLLTPIGAAGFAAVMVVAFWSIHRKNGFFIFRPGEGWEYVMTLLLCGLLIGTVGPGEWSIDHAAGIADDLDGWTGLLVAAVGGGGGSLLLLTTFWRPEAVEPAAAD